MLRHGLVLTLLLSPAGALAAAPSLEPGGALRIGYSWTDFDPANRGNLDLELVRVDLACAGSRLLCSLQYRWYDGFATVQHAWVGVEPAPGQVLKAGVVQAPFGLLPVASHSFWFGSGYYLGLEDDYDLGAVWTRDDGTWRSDVALFAADEYGSGREDGRYSFDLATTAEHPYRERERLVARLERTVEQDGWTRRAGASLSAGRIQRRPDGRRFDHLAGALHAQANRGPLELQLQWAHYRYDVPDERVALTAFLFPFEVAAEADVLTANAAWTFQPARGFDSITCYNDFSTTRPGAGELAHSVQNVTGCSFTRGVMTAYVDWIAGRNMWFAGGPGIGIREPGSERWHSRLNINVGFYF